MGSVEATCLNPGDLLYGEFNCKANSMILTKTDLDPILDVLPYFGDHYTIKPQLSTDNNGNQFYVINIEYNPPDSVYLGDNFESYIAERKQSALDYLQGQGIDLNNYKIEETYYYIH